MSTYRHARTGERVRPVPGSKEDQRLRASKAWERDTGGQAAGQDAPAAPAAGQEAAQAAGQRPAPGRAGAE